MREALTRLRNNAPDYRHLCFQKSLLRVQKHYMVVPGESFWPVSGFGAVAWKTAGRYRLTDRNSRRRERDQRLVLIARTVFIIP